MSSDGMRPRRRGAAAAVVAASLALVASGCSSSGSSSKGSTGTAASADKSSTVKINLTSQGCEPQPAKVPAGAVEFDVTNAGAGSVSEAELRTSDLAHILGEQENLTPGLSGGFSLTIQPGTYKINCPGASQPDWTFTVTGKAAGPSWQSNPQLVTAVQGYAGYVKQNTADLVSHTQTFCQAIDARDMNQARALYPQARVYYERIEPVAEVWGSLDTSIDGRWENPVTVKSQFTGFHRLEQMLWQDNSLNGASAMCSGLVKNEQQLLTLVSKRPVQPAGDGQRGHRPDQRGGHVQDQRRGGALLQHRPARLRGQRGGVHEGRHAAAALPAGQGFRPGAADPAAGRRGGQPAGALHRPRPVTTRPGTWTYSTVTKSDRRQLSAAVNALAEAMSKVSPQVSA